jgi:hypothetical protein
VCGNGGQKRALGSTTGFPEIEQANGQALGKFHSPPVHYSGLSPNTRARTAVAAILQRPQLPAPPGDGEGPWVSRAKGDERLVELIECGDSSAQGFDDLTGIKSNR